MATYDPSDVLSVALNLRDTVDDWNAPDPRNQQSPPDFERNDTFVDVLVADVIHWMSLNDHIRDDITKRQKQIERDLVTAVEQLKLVIEAIPESASQAKLKTTFNRLALRAAYGLEERPGKLVDSRGLRGVRRERAEYNEGFPTGYGRRWIPTKLVDDIVAAAELHIDTGGAKPVFPSIWDIEPGSHIEPSVIPELPVSNEPSLTPGNVEEPEQPKPPLPKKVLTAEFMGVTALAEHFGIHDGKLRDAFRVALGRARTDNKIPSDAWRKGGKTGSRDPRFEYDANHEAIIRFAAPYQHHT